jgi:hypothetical protein
MTIVTCKTDGCVNKDIPISFAEIGEKVICGPCGHEITDKVAA